jgi:hypothetical protein
VTIDAYLAELARRLPRLGRRRIIAEVEGHLRDSTARHEAAGLARSAAEEAATRDFGDVALMARRLAAEVAVRETRAAPALALAAIAVFVFPLYVVPENTLPPAEWATKPRDILALQVITISLWLAAGALAAVSALLAWTRWSRFASPVLQLSFGALTASVAASLILAVRWTVTVPDAIVWPLLAAPLALGCLAVCAEAAGWAHSRRCRLVQD